MRRLIIELIALVAVTTSPTAVAVSPTLAGTTLKADYKPIDRLEIKPPEAIKEAQTVYIAPKVQTPSTSPVVGCGDNAYANFIYMHESGCKLRNPNGSGCDGIGQACPAGKLTAVCPNMDYACQNAYFTNYANRYGGWAGAYAFWQLNHWW